MRIRKLMICLFAASFGKDMMIQNRNILFTNEIQGLKGFESMSIVGTTSTYHTLSSVYFRHKTQLTNIS